MKDQGGLTDDLGKQSAVGTPGTLLGKGSAIKGPGDTQSLLLPAWLLSHNPQRTGPAAEAPGSRGSSEPPLVLRAPRGFPTPTPKSGIEAIGIKPRGLGHCRATLTSPLLNPTSFSNFIKESLQPSATSPLLPLGKTLPCRCLQHCTTAASSLWRTQLAAWAHVRIPELFLPLVTHFGLHRPLACGSPPHPRI
ncbi:uncharacterized protein LOC119256300 isoform X3 [Talpa occidentalis]|uniref:uncharacterized protein LOC119256300 isoform X3 n=1 Tax=Talpa occidentalis TaxID=50954 RepID=UPI0023F6279A|nr:uncharacterized protein LOC119256300 isoform X3 [Talpa occidentalis]